MSQFTFTRAPFPQTRMRRLRAQEFSRRLVQETV
jgi:delta-aminolevulinic acid dehydratase/porphobilinogen synthase